MPNGEALAPLLKADVCHFGTHVKLWVQKTGVLACQHSYLLWFLKCCCYVTKIILKTFALTWLDEKKNWKLNSVNCKCAPVGLLMTGFLLLFSACYFAYLSVSEPTSAKPWWVWRTHFSPQHWHCGSGWWTVGACSALRSSPCASGHILILREHTLDCWFASPLHLLHLFIAVACAFLNIDQSSTFHGSRPVCSQLVISMF